MPPELDDVELLREAARGEVTAIAIIYDRFAGLLQTMAEKILMDRAMAEDHRARDGFPHSDANRGGRDRQQCRGR